MSKGRNRMVYQCDDGKWANKRNDAEKASSYAPCRRRAKATKAFCGRNSVLPLAV